MIEFNDVNDAVNHIEKNMDTVITFNFKGRTVTYNPTVPSTLTKLIHSTSLCAGILHVQGEGSPDEKDLEVILKERNISVSISNRPYTAPTRDFTPVHYSEPKKPAPAPIRAAARPGDITIPAGVSVVRGTISNTVGLDLTNTTLSREEQLAALMAFIEKR